jgi:hypothetical protein
MTDECKLGYDEQGECQRFNIIGCRKGYFEELKDKDNPLGIIQDCKNLVVKNE